MSSKADIKVCPYPFARTEVRANKFVPCCHGWLTSEYHEMETGSDPWNGPAAQELRRRIYKGDYSLCRRDLCGVPITTLEENEEHEAQITAANQQAVLRQETVMPSTPSSICVVADPRCNLACSSCRPGHILTVNSDDRMEMEASDRFLKEYASTLEVIRFAGDGEVFFSSWKRKALAGIQREQYPKLQFIEITTNGLFFDRENMEKLRPGSEFIQRVSVSMDAGNEETYNRVRGGDWKRLLRNLEWMSELRQEKKLKRFQINCTVRKENVDSLVELVHLGNRLKVDSVKFTAFEPWLRMGISDYKEQAIHLPDHPEHSRLHAAWKQICNESRVRWSLTVPQSPSMENNESLQSL